MRWRSKGFLALLLLAAGCAAWPFAPSTPPSGAEGLIEALRAGGHVIYLRHADTEFWHSDASAVVLEDCSTQRNLSNTGREQARAIGSGLARLLVPIGEVRSSPYCRCAETARLAFDRVLLDPDLAPLANAAPTQVSQREAAVRALFGTMPAPGTNTVLVSHADNFAAIAGVDLREGEAAVLKPVPGGGFQLVAQVPAGAWAKIDSPPPAVSGKALR